MDRFAQDVLNGMENASGVIFTLVLVVISAVMLKAFLIARKNRYRTPLYYGDKTGDIPSTLHQQPVRIRKVDYFADIYGKTLLYGVLVCIAFLLLIILALVALQAVAS